MFPANGPPELSTAREGEVFTRSLPNTWSMVKKGLVISTGALQVSPLSLDFANPMLLPKDTGNVLQTIYAFREFAAKRGTEDCPSSSRAATTRRGVQVGPLGARILLVKVLEISTPPGENGVKLLQLTMTRLLSGSTSMNSLSAASSGVPASTAPCGLVAGVISKGPFHVCPQSLET